jgi:hypothetical protein
MKKALTILAILLSSIFYSQDLGRMEFLDSISNKMVVRKYQKEYMKFVSPLNKKDTIYIGVMADSISVSSMDLSLYGYFPDNIKLNMMNVIIEYNDGTEDCFRFKLVDDSNYAVFTIVNDLRYIYIKTPKKIKFRNFCTYTIDSKNKDFFVNFFKNYN